MATSPPRSVHEERPPLVARLSDDDADRAEVTLFEPNRRPEERTARWITADADDCIPLCDWR